MAVLSIGDKRLGAVLLDRGYVSDDNLQDAIGRHAEVGGRLSDILVNIGIISEQRIARAIEEAIGIPVVALPRIDISPEALAKVPADLAQEMGAVPFNLEGNRLRVAFADPLDALSIEEIEDESDCIVEPYKALSKELEWALATYYPELGLTPPADFDSDPEQRIDRQPLSRQEEDEQRHGDRADEDAGRHRPVEGERQRHPQHRRMGDRVTEIRHPPPDHEAPERPRRQRHPDPREKGGEEECVEDHDPLPWE